MFGTNENSLCSSVYLSICQSKNKSLGKISSLLLSRHNVIKAYIHEVRFLQRRLVSAFSPSLGTKGRCEQWSMESAFSPLWGVKGGTYKGGLSLPFLPLWGVKGGPYNGDWSLPSLPLWGVKGGPYNGGLRPTLPASKPQSVTKNWQF